MVKQLALFLLLLSAPAYGQNVEGQIVAAQYGVFQVVGYSDETSTTGFVFPDGACQVSGGGKNFVGVTTGVPIKVVDGNPLHTEIATPSAVNVSGCTVSVTTTYSHQLPYFLTSGTGGLQEAINANGTGQGANTIVLNADWYALVPPGVAATVIGSVKGNTSLGLVDVTTTPYTYYSWNGSAYASTGSGGASFPNTNGLVKNTSTTASATASAADVVSAVGNTPVALSNGTPVWQRAGVVLAPIPADLSQQVQEISGMLSTSPEVLTGCTQVLKTVFSAGWLTSTVQLWSAESCDGIHFTRAPSPIPGTVGYARSFMMPTLVGGNIVLFAVNTNNNHLDMFTGTTIAGLTVAHSNVLSCGSVGDQTSAQGTFTAWITSGNNWSGLQLCGTTTGTYALWSVSSTNAGVNWTNYQTGAVLGDTGVNCGGQCTDMGDRGIYYTGTNAYFWAHVGPGDAVLPTPYIWEFHNPDGLGHSWTAFASPSITAISNLEGVNLPTSGTLGPQLGDVFILPWPELGRTFAYFAAYAPGCASATCAIPSYIEAATIPLPIATIAPLQQTDGPYTLGSPLFQVNSVPQSNPWLHNLVAGPGITITDLGNGSIQIASTSTYQDFASFVGSSGTLLSAYTTQAGKTFALYSNDGVSSVIPQLNGSSAAYQPSGTITTYSSGLDTLTPSSANYTVGGTFSISTAGAQVVLFGRANSAANTNYQIECTQGTNCDLYALVSGSATLIGSATPGWTGGGTHTLTLVMSGTTISATFDGTTVISGTNSSIATAGQAGFRVTGGSSATVANFYVQ